MNYKEKEEKLYEKYREAVRFKRRASLRLFNAEEKLKKAEEIIDEFYLKNKMGQEGK